MAKFMAKPREAEAWQWDGTPEMLDMLKTKGLRVLSLEYVFDGWHCVTFSDGNHCVAAKGDWFVRDPGIDDADFIVIDDSEFQKYYDPA